MGNFKSSFLSYYKNYINSFKTLSRSNLISDLISLPLIFGIFFGFFTYLNKLSKKLFDNKTPEMMKVEFLSFSIDQMETFTNDLKSFVLFFVIGFSLLIISTIFIYSYSRIRIWSNSLKIKHNKKMLKKFAFSTLLFVPLISLIFFVIYFLQTLLINFVINLFSSQYAGEVFKFVTSLIIIFVILNLFFSFKFSLFKSGLVWNSIPEGFSLLRRNFKKLMPVIFLQMVSLFLITLFLNLFLSIIQGVNYLWFDLIRMIMFISLYTWSRNYFYQTVKDDHKHHKS